MYTHINTPTHIHTCIHTYLHTYVYMYIYIHITQLKINKKRQLLR